MDSSDLDAEAVARKAMNIAADMCIYTNKEFLVETMETKEKEEEV
jgi:ATP-dependent HslUV protease subunit HslV